MSMATTAPREAWAARRAQAVRAVVLFTVALLGGLVLVALLARWITNFVAELAAMAELQISAKAGTRPYGLLAARLLAEDYASGGVRAATMSGAQG